MGECDLYSPLHTLIEVIFYLPMNRVDRLPDAPPDAPDTMSVCFNLNRFIKWPFINLDSCSFVRPLLLNPVHLPFSSQIDLSPLLLLWTVSLTDWLALINLGDFHVRYHIHFIQWMNRVQFRGTNVLAHFPNFLATLRTFTVRAGAVVVKRTFVWKNQRASGIAGEG